VEQVPEPHVYVPCLHTTSLLLEQGNTMDVPVGQTLLLQVEHEELAVLFVKVFGPQSVHTSLSPPALNLPMGHATHRLLVNA
jgi:hypothetical protein